MKSKLLILMALSLMVMGLGLLRRQQARAQANPSVYLPIILGSGVSGDPHASITSYNGPETCVACHLKEANDAHASVHYQQSGPTPNVPNIPGDAGKSNGAFNTYCGTIQTSRFATCAGCHTGYGQKPLPEATPEQLNNVDCLMCHQNDYARTAAGPYEYIDAVDPDGGIRQIRVPIEDENGFHFMPDESKMSITALEAAQTVHATTRTTCLRCHAGASGSDGGKRGDLSSVTANPPLSSDMHMSPQGQDMVCADCHDAGSHEVRGRGLDLRPNDVDERFECAHCHTATPHDDGVGSQPTRDSHALSIACQTCHIPTFAKDVSTEMERDWLNPFYSETACSGQGGWKPEEIRESDVIPSYEWFNGTSYVYALGQVAQQNDDGEYALGVPLGDVTDAAAKIYPMKEHRSISALHVATGQLVPHSTFTFFTTGDFYQAVDDGMAQVGLTGAYDMVPVHTFQTINHGVEEADNALECGDCHQAYADEDAQPRMDLVGELGYALKGPEEQVCTQCHDQEDMPDFAELHSEHVREEDVDCAACHTFTRPERGLELP